MTLQTVSNQVSFESQKTTAGSYFVSNYPPFSFWEPCDGQYITDTIDAAPAHDTPLGLYFHIPFCRKRCRFCYFKVYTDKKSAEIRDYTNALQRELSLYANKPFLGGRTPEFIYLGGGTPSYLSTHQLRSLVKELDNTLSWAQAREIAFECEPGTLSGDKLDVIRDLGITRLSLGIENFDDRILEQNGRAHRSLEIFRTFEHARSLGFPQINIDLIAGMVGETEENWQKNIECTLELQPDIVTVYQMEIPYNTSIYKEMKEAGETIAPIADWETKRRWVDYGFQQFSAAGYEITSAYSAVKKDIHCEFLYRDNLWQGADLLSLGVSSFSHIQNIHFQNEKNFDPYLESVRAGRYPIRRALKLTEEERLIREFILQLKKGFVRKDYFQNKFQVDVTRRFAQPLQRLQKEDLLTVEEQEIRLSRQGLLQVDCILPNFYLARHQGARYT